jgi:hypothetical protein
MALMINTPGRGKVSAAGDQLPYASINWIRFKGYISAGVPQHKLAPTPLAIFAKGIPKYLNIQVSLCSKNRKTPKFQAVTG